MILAAAIGLAGSGACTERLESGAGCPLLCPTQDIVLRDTIIEGVVLDTVVQPFPPVGQEVYHPLVSRGDTLETRVVIRFDTLPDTYRPGASPTPEPITVVEDAHIRLRLRYPLVDADRPVTIEAYDVDSTGAEADADTTGRTALPQFRPERFLGSATFIPAELSDSLVRIPLSDSAVLEKIVNAERLRIGLRAAEGTHANLQLSGITGDFVPRVVFGPGTDTLLFALPTSGTPLDNRFFTAALIDYTLIVKSAEPFHIPQTISVGGTPGRRTYLRFDIPPAISDTASIVRATLMLTQRPNPFAPDPADSITMYSQAAIASAAVTDLTRAAGFIDAAGRFGVDSLRVPPEASGPRVLDLSILVRVWRVTTPAQMPRALILRIPEEGFNANSLHFYSTEAPEPALRPQLRLIYSPRVPLGVP